MQPLPNASQQCQPHTQAQREDFVFGTHQFQTLVGVTPIRTPEG